MTNCLSGRTVAVVPRTSLVDTVAADYDGSNLRKPPCWDSRPSVTSRQRPPG